MATSTTRDRIIEAGLELFASQGFGGTTISAVEREVGLTPGTGSFYRHFASKEELLTISVRHEVDAVVTVAAEQRAALPDLDDPEDTLLQGYEQVLADLRNFDRLIRIHDKVGDEFPEVREVVSEALAAASSGPWNDDPRVLVAVAALSGYVLVRRLPGGPFDQVDDAQFLRMLVQFNRT